MHLAHGGRRRGRVEILRLHLNEELRLSGVLLIEVPAEPEQVVSDAVENRAGPLHRPARGIERRQPQSPLRAGGSKAQLMRAAGEGETGAGPERTGVVVLDLCIGASGRTADAAASEAFEAAVRGYPGQYESVAAGERRYAASIPIRIK